ncbi:hypothetical protein M8818_007653 [Zalaria obscura]|uniref:Uncharacterized protein n=1 Tax=Zalaria obscura TaxID=2024903 RepID=A0ACC3S382_9PEZI
MVVQVTTFAASIYSPGSKQISTHQEIAILPLALYNLGLAFGPLIGSPLGETHGRKAVVLITTPIFAFFTLGAGLSSNVASLTICRFFAGVFAAPAVGNASATIMDFTSERSRGSAMDFYYSVPTLGASLGPLVGGFVVQYRGWRWTQWTILFFTVAFYVPVVFTRETYKQTILWRRAKKLGIQGPPRARRTVLQSVHHFVATLLLRPIHMLLTEPIVTLVCLYNGFMFGLMYTYVVASPWVYSHYYGFNQTAVNLSFLGLIIGCIIAPIVLLTIEKLIFQPRLAAFRRNHTAETSFPPENRLYPAMMASFGLPATLFTFAWTTRKSIHWICPMILQGLTMVCNLMVYASANLFMMDVYGPLYGASAAGAAMLSRYLLSAAFPLFSLQMYQSLGLDSLNQCQRLKNALLQGGVTTEALDILMNEHLVEQRKDSGVVADAYPGANVVKSEGRRRLTRCVSCSLTFPQCSGSSSCRVHTWKEHATTRGSCIPVLPLGSITAGRTFEKSGSESRNLEY